MSQQTELRPVDLAAGIAALTTRECLSIEPKGTKF